MMAAFKQALEDFSKGPEASKVLEGASPLGALLEFGKQALAKAGAQPPSLVVGRGDRRAARVRAAPAGAPAQAATAPAAAAPALAPPAPGQARRRFPLNGAGLGTTRQLIRRSQRCRRG